MRVVTPVGVSTAGLFEVGNLPEVTAVNNTRNTAVPITFPCVVNGAINGTPNGGAERHYFRFHGKSGERLVFNLKAFRYNLLTQLFFNPALHIYDSNGTEIAENHGYYELDPLLDWKCPADGSYSLEVRDMLGRGNPGNVYRMTIGQLPYDTVVYPPAVQAGSSETVRLIGKDVEGTDTSFKVPSINSLGLASIGSPYGAQEIYVSGFPVFTKDKTVVAPACMTGQLTRPGESDTFTVQGDGTFDFEAYSERLGSSVPVRCRLSNCKRKNIARSDRDERMTATLQAGQTYSLKVRPFLTVDQMQCVTVVKPEQIHQVMLRYLRFVQQTSRSGPACQLRSMQFFCVEKDAGGDIIPFQRRNLPAARRCHAELTTGHSADRKPKPVLSAYRLRLQPITLTVNASGSGEFDPLPCTASGESFCFRIIRSIPFWNVCSPLFAANRILSG